MQPPFSIRVKFDLLKVGHCQHAECAALRGGSRRAIDFPALVGLIEHPHRGLMLYDTGYSRHFWDATRRVPECLYRLITPVQLPPEQELLAQLEERKISPGDIDTIFISHFHADHVAGLRDFPQARFIATQAERRFVEKKGRLGRLRRAYLRDLLPADLDARLTAAENTPQLSLPQSLHPFTKCHDLLGDTSMLGIDLPGHAASQLGLAFAVENEAAPIFLVGDACWKIEGLQQNRPPSRLAYALFHDGKSYDETFAHLRTLHLSSQAPTLIPSHCSTTWAQRGGTRHIHRD
ncbi:MBL fold metallo-hydrolase [Prosthecobacter sp.]|uniref:MBL fold metallo-hydrolase n=1 Tax=Prosthecobacter sp. TaxID=1965333 RepID=UPI003784F164